MTHDLGRPLESWYPARVDKLRSRRAAMATRIREIVVAAPLVWVRIRAALVRGLQTGLRQPLYTALWVEPWNAN